MTTPPPPHPTRSACRRTRLPHPLSATPAAPTTDATDADNFDGDDATTPDDDRGQLEATSSGLLRRFPRRTASPRLGHRRHRRLHVRCPGGARSDALTRGDRLPRRAPHRPHRHRRLVARSRRAALRRRDRCRQRRPRHGPALARAIGDRCCNTSARSSPSPARRAATLHAPPTPRSTSRCATCTTSPPRSGPCGPAPGGGTAIHRVDPASGDVHGDHRRRRTGAPISCPPTAG